VCSGLYLTLLWSLFSPFYDSSVLSHSLPTLRLLLADMSLQVRAWPEQAC